MAGKPESPELPQINELSRGQLLMAAQRFTEMAAQVAAEPSHTKPIYFGGPKDPTVRKLAGLALVDMHDVKNMSFDEIGTVLSVSRERVFQLYKDIVGATAENGKP